MPDTTRLTITLADVITALQADPSLAPTRRRDLCSAVRRVAGMLERDPARLPASLPEIRRALACVTPAQAGILTKTFQNIRSDLLAALRHVGANRHPGTACPPLSPPWPALYERLPEQRLQNGLSRFFRFCSSMGIEPEQIDDGVMDQFMSFVREHTLARKPNDIHRRTCRIWNEATNCVPGWPQVVFSVPDYREPRTALPLSAFPAPFQAEVERYLDWLTNPDPFDEGRLRWPLKPGTITLRRKQIELAASARVKRGNPPEALSSLADLVQLETVKEILRHYLSRNEPVTPAFLNNLAQSLFSIAKDWVRVDETRLAALREVRRRLPTVPFGMTSKNRTMLRQFEDEANLERLLSLPSQMIQEVTRAKKPEARAAIMVQIALAIEVLIQVPIRMANLTPLRIGEHLVRPGGPGSLWHLTIPPAETKNSEPIEFPLPRVLTDLLDLYLERYRPRLAERTNTCLFPGQGRGHKDQRTLSQQITETIAKRTGLRLTPHQFRHLSAALYLKHNPGQFVVVQKLLGHKNLKTTLSFYAGLDAGTAAQYYDDFIARQRARLEALSQKPRRRRARNA